jgi:hypothetical protein
MSTSTKILRMSLSKRTVWKQRLHHTLYKYQHRLFGLHVRKNTHNSTLSDSYTDSGPELISKYFANAAIKRKRQSQAASERLLNEESDSSEPSEFGQASNDEWIQPPIPGMNKIYRRYLPDKSKCNYYFVQKRRCDRNTVGVPCTHYRRSRSHCIDQTTESQSLISPNDRDHRQQVLDTQCTEQDPPCRRCYAKGRTCIRNGPGGTPCNGCKRHYNGCSSDHIVRQCHFDLTSITAPNKTNACAGGEHAVPYDQKCYRRATQDRVCNGKYPCNNCTTTITARSCKNVLEAKTQKELNKCTHCKRIEMFCDKERLCSTCTRLKTNCFYIDQGGLLTRTYKVEGVYYDGPYTTLSNLPTN